LRAAAAAAAAAVGAAAASVAMAAISSTEVATVVVVALAGAPDRIEQRVSYRVCVFILSLVGALRSIPSTVIVMSGELASTIVVDRAVAWSIVAWSSWPLVCLTNIANDTCIWPPVCSRRRPPPTLLMIMSLGSIPSYEQMGSRVSWSQHYLNTRRRHTFAAIRALKSASNFSRSAEVSSASPVDSKVFPSGS
jgi:hypothetical protein